MAPVSGLMLDWLYKADRSTAPVPLFEIHGTEDKTSAWLGDPQNKGGWGAYLPVPLAVHYWAAKNRCTVMQTDTLPAKAPGGRTVIAHRFTGRRWGSEVWLYEIVGGKHAWGEQDIDTGEELMEILQQVRKVGGTSPQGRKRSAPNAGGNKKWFRKNPEPFRFQEAAHPRPRSGGLAAALSWRRSGPWSSAPILIGFSRLTSPARIRFESSLTM